MTDLITLLASLGIGSLIGILLQTVLQNRSRINERQFDFKEKRYKALMILMWTSLNPESELKHLKLFRDDIRDAQTLEKELQLELFNCLLFAGDGVIKSLKEFIKRHSQENYLKVSLAMRKDLYGKNTKISFEDIK